MRLRRKSPWHGIMLRENFVLHEEIASGGFSTIVKAKDIQKNEDVAIKIGLAKDGSDHSDIILSESNFLVRLKHRSIVSTRPIPRADKVDVFCARARTVIREPYFFVMEYLEGGTLAKYLDRVGTLSHEETAAIALPIARAVKHVHQTGYAHNDLKLENIVFRSPVAADQPFTPILIDFGVVSKILTPPGLSMYITPPEQIERSNLQTPPEIGSMIDHKQADVWGMGVVLYRMLGGQLPFSNNSRHKIEDCITSERPKSLQRLSRRVSREWDEFVIDGCLAKKPEHRNTMSELINWMRPYGRGVVASTTGNGSKKGLLGKLRGQG